MIKTFSSRFSVFSPLITLILGANFGSYAYAGMENYTPTHPECTIKPAMAPAVTPAVVPTPLPASVPLAVPIAKGTKDTDGDGVIDSIDKCPNTPRGYKVDPTGCPVSVTLHLHFPFNSSVIPVSDYPEVARLSKIMKENPSAKAIIVGHTDSAGADVYNQKLSERRSKALGDRLIANGIQADRITTSGKGEKEPLATNSTSKGRALNRRIQVDLQ